MCECNKILDTIEVHHCMTGIDKHDSWNMGYACKYWNDHKKDLTDNGHRGGYGCACPTCGKSLCNWCE